ncbi:hypothetical protein DM02DRAFT_685238 [Periconia macrospinosa]|uniref:Uncharacterized protein n=1 Tax=Periconia macrospinosa TaxID=97972 RepID=A0A2V1DH82_9PLEO|nr:hypothetical protein DM02DRAFT_685238 [Periconia macrospinosa]
MVLGKGESTDTSSAIYPASTTREQREHAERCPIYNPFPQIPGQLFPSSLQVVPLQGYIDLQSVPAALTSDHEDLQREVVTLRAALRASKPQVSETSLRREDPNRMETMVQEQSESEASETPPPQQEENDLHSSRSDRSETTVQLAATLSNLGSTLHHN